MRLEKEIIKTKIGVKLAKIFNRSEIKKLSKEVGFVKRESLLGGFDFATLNMQSVGSEGYCSLTEQCSLLSHHMDIIISKQGLDWRYNKSACELMKQVLERVINLNIEKQLQSLGLSAFNGIVIRDATSKQLPASFASLFSGSGGSASESGIKIDLQYDIQGTELDIELRDGCSNDAIAKPLKVRADTIYLQDLGYFNLSKLASIDNQKGYFINRYKQPTNIYNQKKDKIKVSIETLSKGMKENEIKEYDVYLGQSQRLKSRLIIQKLPLKVALKRQDQLKKQMKKKGKNLSKRRLDLCHYTLMITNISATLLSAAQILHLYGLRWQIEIMFKCWKSVMELLQIHPMKAERFLCMLYGQMIWIVLSMKLTSFFRVSCWNLYHIELSELKFFKILKMFQLDFWEALISNSKSKIRRQLQKLAKTVFFHAQKEPKKNRINPLFDEAFALA